LLGAALERDQASRGGDETAGLDVEGAELFIEIGVQPFTAGGTTLLYGKGDHPRPDTSAAGMTRHERVEDEGVDATIPCDVHETDELAAVSRADPAKAVPPDLSLPVVREDAMAETLGMQRVDLGVLEVSAPVIRNVHRTIVSPNTVPPIAVGSSRRTTPVQHVTLIADPYAGLSSGFTMTR